MSLEPSTRSPGWRRVAQPEGDELKTKRKPERRSVERERLRLAVIDELDAIDDVLSALPQVRRLMRSAGPDGIIAPVLDRAIDEALEALVRSRLRGVARAVRSIR